MKNTLNAVNLFSFPLNIVIVDDNEEYLDLTRKQLMGINCTKYSSAEEVINDLIPLNINVKEFFEENFTGVKDLNFKNIKNFVENDNSQTGILISDYDMPNINGVELFAKYQDTNYLIKILLTNVYTIEKALDALHKHIIHYYLPKEKLPKINKIIKELQNYLFNQITRDILRFVDTTTLDFIYDKTFAELFNSTCIEYDIEKYYILNSYGHYYLESKTHKFVFSIYKDTDLLEIATDIPKYMNDVKSGKLIPSHFSLENGSYNLIPAKNYAHYNYFLEKFNYL